jgi:hypothetical protein
VTVYIMVLGMPSNDGLSTTVPVILGTTARAGLGRNPRARAAVQARAKRTGFIETSRGESDGAL